MDVCVTLLAAGATLDRVDDKVPHTHNTRHTPHDTRDSYMLARRARRRTTWRRSTATPSAPTS